MSEDHPPSPLASLLQPLTAYGEAAAGKRGLLFRTRILPDCPQALTLDIEALHDALLELLDNAVRYTRTGVVRLTLASGDDPGSLRCTVEDSGNGIAAERLDALLAAAMGADNGLPVGGLAQVATLARQLGGQFSAHSEPGRGSRFQLLIPLQGQQRPAAAAGIAAVAEPPTAADQRFAQLGGRVLMAEDNRANALLISHLLERVGTEVRTVADGQAALEAAQWEEFDLILMDMRMPVMDGLEATRMLRLTGFARPIIALTANTSAEDRAAARAAGCDAFLAKPIKTQPFFQTLAHFLHPEDAVATGMTDDSAVDPGFLAALQAEFQETLPIKLAALKQGLRDGDLEHIAAVAHQLKGVAGNFGRPEVTHSSGQLEQAARQGDHTTVSEILAVLESQCRSPV